MPETHTAPTPAPPPIETTLTRILVDADCEATRPLRHRETRRGHSLRALFAVSRDGRRLVPLFPLGCYGMGGAQ